MPTARGGRAVLCCPLLSPADRRLCPLDDVSRAAEAEDPARPADHPVTRRRAAARLVLLTFRPDFSPPWTGRSHLTQVTLHRLMPRQTVEMTARVAHGKALPPEVVEQVVAKTDGVPLFVEELTKMVLESGLLREREERYELTGPLPPLAIPVTLQDSLMARLDRLATVKTWRNWVPPSGGCFL